MVSVRRRRNALTGLVAIAALLLTGCALDSPRSDFSRSFGGDEAVADLELSTVDNMPFTGGVSAEVSVRDDVSDPDLLALVDRLSAFAAARPADKVRIVVVAKDLTLPVSRDSDLAARTTVAAIELRDDDRVASVALTPADDDDRVSGASLILSAEADAVAAFTLAEDAPRVLGEAAAPYVTVQSRDRATLVRGVPGPWLDDAERMWTAVSGAVAATAFRAEPGRLEVSLAGEDSLAPAALAAAEAPEDLVVVFSSPRVALGAGATGDPVRALLAALPAEPSAAVGSVWTDDDRAVFAVDSVDEARLVASAVSGRPESGVFSTVSVTVRSAGSLTLDVRSAPPALSADVEAAAVLLADPRIASVVGSDRSVTVTVAGDPSDADLESLMPAARRLAGETARVCVNRAAGTGECEAAER
ncbi:hypothetical protein GRS96_09170 [Rathayibacter sp. VKM Ac-2803]|uniref:hypothetical protein n=1 Tax=Rathayibacter sp. VKM Ac-2803 TaxID=2609256 RepID=UPI00135AB749|nr:hypothetical protein [Rathayibacter sp. VKM Ac-2803]MWV49442.1 hypothetical protein [Rathayibacter sp. VKM Ac-2803]